MGKQKVQGLQGYLSIIQPNTFSDSHELIDLFSQTERLHLKHEYGTSREAKLQQFSYLLILEDIYLFQGFYQVSFPWYNNTCIHSFNLTEISTLTQISIFNEPLNFESVIFLWISNFFSQVHGDIYERFSRPTRMYLYV